VIKALRNPTFPSNMVCGPFSLVKRSLDRRLLDNRLPNLQVFNKPTIFTKDLALLADNTYEITGTLQ
jgi:hypothetical protein